MTPLWTAIDFIKAVGPVVQPGPIDDVSGISIDSRTVAKGDAFFAIKGERFDAHDFARSALDAGAAVVVLESEQQDKFNDLKDGVVFVDDALQAMEKLGRAARSRVAGKVVAITGSVGKTSTKDAMRAALAPSGKVHAAVASFNNHWGVPLTLARMPADSDFGVFEVGMNHPGEIRYLIDMVQPDIAIITTIAPAHIGNFNSIDEIAAAKAEIFEGVVAGGHAIINGDNAFADVLAEAARQCEITNIHRFGKGEDADIRLSELVLSSDGSDLTVSLFGEIVCCHLGAPGEHLAFNALSVIGAVHLAGADVAKACNELSEQGASKGRGERHVLPLEGGDVLLIDESYNANPSSVSAALATLGLSKAAGRKIAVLGDMLELGEESPDMHKALIKPLEDAGVDRVFLSGPMMKFLWQEVPIAKRGSYGNSSADLVGPLLAEVEGGDVIMIKGSLGSKMGPLVNALLEACSK